MRSVNNKGTPQHIACTIDMDVADVTGSLPVITNEYKKYANAVDHIQDIG
jgi:hypothetical protein